VVATPVWIARPAGCLRTVADVYSWSRVADLLVRGPISGLTVNSRRHRGLRAMGNRDRPPASHYAGRRIAVTGIVESDHGLAVVVALPKIRAVQWVEKVWADPGDVFAIRIHNDAGYLQPTGLFLLEGLRRCPLRRRLWPDL
jgi:hypothetical protein